MLELERPTCKLGQDPLIECNCLDGPLIRTVLLVLFPLRLLVACLGGDSGVVVLAPTLAESLRGIQRVPLLGVLLEHVFVGQNRGRLVLVALRRTIGQNHSGIQIVDLLNVGRVVDWRLRSYIRQRMGSGVEVYSVFQVEIVYVDGYVALLLSSLALVQGWPLVRPLV